MHYYKYWIIRCLWTSEPSMPCQGEGNMNSPTLKYKLWCWSSLYLAISFMHTESVSLHYIIVRSHIAIPNIPFALFLACQDVHFSLFTCLQEYCTSRGGDHASCKTSSASWIIDCWSFIDTTAPDENLPSCRGVAILLNDGGSWGRCKKSITGRHRTLCWNGLVEPVIWL